MILSSDELEILEYLKSWDGKPVSIMEIGRCAGGRRKFRGDPHWAKGLMSRLVDEKLVTVNERGHYQYVMKETVTELLDENYFPAEKPGAVGIIGDDYFPPPALADSDSQSETQYWVSPGIAAILKNSGKTFGSPASDD